MQQLQQLQQQGQDYLLLNPAEDLLSLISYTVAFITESLRFAVPRSLPDVLCCCNGPVQGTAVNSAAISHTGLQRYVLCCMLLNCTNKLRFGTVMILF
jgi:hypothetical protein